MRFKRSCQFAFSLLAAMAMMTGSASATHTDFTTWTLSSYVHDAYANSDTTVTYNATRATTQTTTLPSGWKVAHADNTTSPFGNNSPNNGDTVATGTAHAKWLPFCIEGDKSITGKWVEPIDTGAPANTVAQINMQTSIFTTKAFVRLISGVYSVYVPDMPDEFVCSSTTNGSSSLTILGTVSGTTRHVAENPASAGTYTANTTYTDTGSTNHSDDVSVTIT
jgi:hypothetical protein